MDAFFASVEQRDNPDLRGKPVAVGGSRERSVVAAASYEARKFGVRSAMPSVVAIRKCPDLIFVRPRFDAYREVSLQIRSIFERFTDLVEPLSLDEAYLDVTTNKTGAETATQIAEDIRTIIFEETGLTASAGVSYNKFLAKMASDQRKPNGLFVIKPSQGESFIESLPIHMFHGIGKAGSEKMKRLGIENGLDLKRFSKAFLQEHFGKAGLYFYDLARGIDNRPVNPFRIRKSLGKEITFNDDMDNFEELQIVLRDLAEQVWDLAQKKEVQGRTAVLKIKFSNFEQITRSKSITSSIASRDSFFDLLSDSFQRVFPLPMKVRLMGVTLSGVDEENAIPSSEVQLDLFS